MRRRTIILSIVSVLLLAAGCGATQGGPGGPGGNPYSGSLVGSGTGYVHQLNLSGTSEWSEMTSISTYDVTAVDLTTNELYVAGLNMANPMLVDVYDLTTFGAKRSFLWPDSQSLDRVERFAVAPGGKYLAANLSVLGEPLLEVMDTEAASPVYTALDYKVASINMVWTKDLSLLLAYEPAGAFDPNVYGAVIMIPLEQFLEDDDDLGAYLVQGFTQAEWGQRGVTYLALSADESQLAYVLNGDIWVKEFAPDAAARQLTTGPTANVGPAFSPSGDHIAFVGLRPLGLNDTLVLPNDGTGPYLVNASDPANSQAYVVDSQNLVTNILAWLQ